MLSRAKVDNNSRNSKNQINNVKNPTSPESQLSMDHKNTLYKLQIPLVLDYQNIALKIIRIHETRKLVRKKNKP